MMDDLTETGRTEVEHEFDEEGRTKKTTTTTFRPLEYTELPFRGSVTEAWVKFWRDKFTKQSESYGALDRMLDDYRLHADTGDPLFFLVSEGGGE